MILHFIVLDGTIYRLQHPLPVVPIGVTHGFDAKVGVHYYLQMIGLKVGPKAAKGSAAVGNDGRACRSYFTFDVVSEFGEFVNVAVGLLKGNVRSENENIQANISPLYPATYKSQRLIDLTGPNP